jgi:hypothetical protein
MGIIKKFFDEVNANAKKTYERQKRELERGGQPHVRLSIPLSNQNAVMRRDWRGGDLMFFRAKPKGCNLCSQFFQHVFSLSGRSRKYPSYETLPQSLRGDKCPACGTGIGWSNYDPTSAQIAKEVAQEIFGDQANEKAEVAHAENQVQKFKRLSAGCLEPQLKAKYDARLAEWEEILKSAKIKLNGARNKK